MSNISSLFSNILYNIYIINSFNKGPDSLVSLPINTIPSLDMLNPSILFKIYNKSSIALDKSYSVTKWLT